MPLNTIKNELHQCMIQGVAKLSLLGYINCVTSTGYFLIFFLNIKRDVALRQETVHPTCCKLQAFCILKTNTW